MLVSPTKADEEWNTAVAHFFSIEISLVLRPNNLGVIDLIHTVLK